MRLAALVLCALPFAAQADPLKIVTDIAPVQSLVAQVIGNRGEVSALLEPNSDPHHFQLRPSQSRDLARADLLVWVGEPLTPWLARAKEGVAAGVESLSFLDSASNSAQSGDGHGHGDDHLADG